VAASVHAQIAYSSASFTDSQHIAITVHNGGYLRAQLLFQLDPSTPARLRPVACLFMIAKRSNVRSSA
jgi:hypothetical protein